MQDKKRNKEGSSEYKAFTKDMWNVVKSCPDRKTKFHYGICNEGFTKQENGNMNLHTCLKEAHKRYGISTKKTDKIPYEEVNWKDAFYSRYENPNFNWSIEENA
jgi:hypothetical protein